MNDCYAAKNELRNFSINTASQKDCFISFSMCLMLDQSEQRFLDYRGRIRSLNGLNQFNPTPLILSGFGSLIILGADTSQSESTTSQRTLTIIIKFDKDKKVRDFAYNYTQF